MPRRPSDADYGFDASDDGGESDSDDGELDIDEHVNRNESDEGFAADDLRADTTRSASAASMSGFEGLLDDEEAEEYRNQIGSAIRKKKGSTTSDYGFEAGGGGDGGGGDMGGFGHDDGEPDLADLYEIDADGDPHASIANDSMGEWYGEVQIGTKALVEKYGDIMPRRYRMQTASERVETERVAFDAQLEVLLARCKRGHQSETTLKDLKLGKVLGEGNFGKVLLVEPRANKGGMPDFMALKIQAKLEMSKDKKELQHVRDEKNLMFAMNCPFLVGCVDYFADKKNIYFALELCNAGEMWSIIQQQKKKRIPNKLCQFWLAQVLLAFEYMHNLDVCYRDLKPENLLVDFKGNVRITDFGFAKRVTEITWTMCGTPDYMAPEIIKQQGHNHAVDWWAFGVLSFELASGGPPFEGTSQLDTFRKIGAVKYTCPSHFSAPLKEMIAQFLVVKTSERLGLQTHKGEERMKGLKYFKGVNWNAMLAGTLPSPYKVKAKHPGDCSNFDEYDRLKPKWYGTDDDGFDGMFDGF